MVIFVRVLAYQLINEYLRYRAAIANAHMPHGGVTTRFCPALASIMYTQCGVWFTKCCLLHSIAAWGAWQI